MNEDYKIKSVYGEIEITNNPTGSVCISQNGKKIFVAPTEIRKLAGGLFAFRKEKFPQLVSAESKPKSSSSPKPPMPELKNSFISQQRKQYANAYQPWTPEEEAKLKKLVEQGMEITEICEQLGRNEGSINSRMKKLNL